MRVFNFLFATVFGLVSSVALSQEAKMKDYENLVYEYEDNLDQNIVGSYAFECGPHTEIAVAKEYLSKQKSKVDMDRSRRAEYFIVDSEEKTHLLTTQVDSDVSIGEVYREEGIINVPVVRVDGSADVYPYSITEKSVLSPRSVESHERQDTDDSFYLYAEKIRVFLRSSTVSVSGIRNEGREGGAIDVYAEGESILDIKDVTKDGRMLYIVGTRVEKRAARGSYLWLTKVSLERGEVEAKTEEVEMDKDSISKVEFVNTTHSTPSILVLRVSRTFRNADLTLFGDDLTRIWKKKVNRIERDRYAVAGVCSDKYVLLEKLDGKNRRGSLEVSFMSETGEILDRKVFKFIDSGIIRDFTALPGNRSLCLYTNFERFEETRRPDGWYSWNGYRIDSFELVCGNED